MVIDFDSMTPEKAEHFKGGEGAALIRKFEDENNKIMLFTLKPGTSVGVHTHTGNSEIIYILKGSGTAFDQGSQRPASAGQCLYCPEGASHGLTNDGDEDLVFFAVVPEHHKK